MTTVPDRSPPRTGRRQTEAAGPPACALVLSGGIALGAFEAGACAALEQAGGPAPGWFAGASIGAVNAAILAGNPPGRRIARLREFWAMVAADPMPVTSFWLGPPPAGGAWRRHYNRAAVLESLLLGRPGLYRPRLPMDPEAGTAPAIFDLGPLRARLPELVDFDRINAGEHRLTLVSTEVVSGDRVVFDTARGTRIGPEHVVASCALLPLFAPVEIDGRLLGDGGLASNLPLDLVLDEPGADELVCFAIELFAREGSRPRSFAASIARAGDLAFGNQTERILEARVRERRLHGLLDRLAGRLPAALRQDPEVAAILAEAAGGARPATVFRLGYHAAPDEAGPGKVFDFARRTLAERWQAGEQAMHQALDRLGAPAASLAPGLVLHEIAAGPATAATPAGAAASQRR